MSHFARPGSPSQSCFDSNPLIFDEDTLYGAPRNPNYPERSAQVTPELYGRVHLAYFGPIKYSWLWYLICGDL
ncbi:hypothetical protein ACHAXR_002851 [Thalassiosira sp. AJA248-18]